MAAKILLCVFAQVLLIQSISAFCAGRGFNAALNGPFVSDRIGADCLGPFGPLAGPYGEIPLSYAASAAASHGGALPVASSSPIPANGVSVLSENVFEGPLAVAGRLPFLGTVALEGALPTAGAGAVNYGCGNGNVAMLNEDFSGYGYEPMAYGYGRGGLCGCGNRF